MCVLSDGLDLDDPINMLLVPCNMQASLSRDKSGSVDENTRFLLFSGFACGVILFVYCLIQRVATIRIGAFGEMFFAPTGGFALPGKL